MCIFCSELEFCIYYLAMLIKDIFCNLCPYTDQVFNRVLEKYVVVFCFCFLGGGGVIWMGVKFTYPIRTVGMQNRTMGYKIWQRYKIWQPSLPYFVTPYTLCGYLK